MNSTYDPTFPRRDVDFTEGPFYVLVDYSARIAEDDEGGDGYMTPNRKCKIISEIEINQVIVMSFENNYTLEMNPLAAQIYFGKLNRTVSDDAEYLLED